MDSAKLQQLLDIKIQEIRDLVNQNMVENGLKKEQCQRVLINCDLNQLQMSVNGIEPGDMLILDF